MSNKAVIILSGGMDSVTTLALAKDRGYDCYTLSFNYGQKSISELDAALYYSKKYHCIKHKVFDINFGDFTDSALTNSSASVLDNSEASIPKTYVPMRNIIFLSIACSWAENINSTNIFIGANAIDYSGYPDCRDETLKAFQLALNLGTDSDFIIETPLMWINKTQSWELADKIGGAALIDLVITHTHTCYLGERDKLNDWGYGCGVCPACDLRRTGYLDWCALKKR